MHQWYGEGGGRMSRSDATVGDQSARQPPRINVGKLLQRFVVSLVLPFGAAVLVDYLIGSAPLLTVAAIVICLPLATVVVSRAALQEMGRVIDAVAPATGLPDAAVSGPEESTGVPRPN